MKFPQIKINFIAHNHTMHKNDNNNKIFDTSAQEATLKMYK